MGPSGHSGGKLDSDKSDDHFEGVGSWKLEVKYVQLSMILFIELRMRAREYYSGVEQSINADFP